MSSGETVKLNEGDSILILRETGEVVFYLEEFKDKTAIANQGVMVMATLAAIFAVDPKEEEAFHAVINNRMKHYFGNVDE